MLMSQILVTFSFCEFVHTCECSTVRVSKLFERHKLVPNPISSLSPRLQQERVCEIRVNLLCLNEPFK